MVKVHFNVSDIAALTGYNKYKTTLDILDLIISYFYKTYPSLKELNNHVSKEDNYKIQIDKLTINNKQKIDSLLAEKLVSSLKLKENTNQIKDIIKEDTTLDHSERKIITEYVTNKNNQNYGIYNEDATIRKYNIKSEYEITDNNTELYIYETELYNTRGRIDGYCEFEGEKHIVEIKNRKNRIFNFIPIYERIQVYYYMKSCNVDKVLFIQMMDDEIDESVIDEFDDELFDETQCRLNIICELLDSLSGDEILREEIIDKKNTDLLTDYIYWG